MTLTRRDGRGGSLKRAAYRAVPFTAFLGLGTAAALDAAYLVVAACGAGAYFTGKRLFDRERNARRELGRRMKANASLLGEVARRDRVAAPQMERLTALQSSVIESWEIMPEEYRTLLDDDIFTILEEIEGTAHLARRRAALRGHLANTDRRGIQARIGSLERDIRDLPEGSAVRQTFETTLAGRQSELDGLGEMLDGINLINAQLESAESLLANLRGDFLTLDTTLSSGRTGAGLARLKERVNLFKRSLDEVKYVLSDVPEPPEARADHPESDPRKKQRPAEELPTR
ncbi:hypothetical protein [Rubrobacter indicoceani]|uniref:hypothetical protein n=1 Tax=Rubrobacter indicoceani TaxID=2051957 RepID=UPI000E5A2F0C|nr:hypothetical protein [Rubrobacter indicoceani]